MRKDLNHDKKKKDRHVKKGILLRLHPDILRQLLLLCERTKNYRTTQIQIAVREQLEREGLWPPAQG